MQNTLSLSAKINANLYRTYGGINPTIMLLMASTYDNVRLLTNASAHFQLINPFLAHNYEIKERMFQMRHLRKMATLCAQILRYGDKSIGQYCLGTGGSLLASSLEMTHNILQMQRVLELNNLAGGLALKGDKTNVDAVKEHSYTDTAPIYVSPIDGKTAVFEPKTIVAVKGFHGNKKHTLSLTSQMTEFLSMSLEERANYLDYYTEIREITKKDAKKDNLDDVMIGQRGLFAKRRIPAYTFMGFYTGAYCATQIECRRTIREVGKNNYDTYVFGFTDQPLPRVNGFGYGNRLTLVNASSCYSGNITKISRDLAHKTNIHVGYARSGENPDQDIIDNPEACDLILYYSEKEINVGQQLFIDYGMNYWKSKVTDYVNTTQDELNKAVRDYRRKQKIAKQKKSLR